MIATFKVGLHPEVSLREHRLELVKRRVSGMEANARRVARQVFKLCQGRVREGQSPAVVSMGPVLETLVMAYGCKRELVPYAVDCVRQLVQDKGLVQ